VTFAGFWPEYVRGHSKPATRLIHCVGTILGWMLLGAAIAVRHWWWIAAAVFISYTMAWLSHFLVEHNKPATFEAPRYFSATDSRVTSSAPGDRAKAVRFDLERQVDLVVVGHARE